MNDIAAQATTLYEIERGKPKPNLTHGAIQANMLAYLIISYHSKFRIASEVALATIPDGTTPDIVIYPKRELNFVNEEAKQSEPPLVTIEIQSPTQSNDEMIAKAHVYFKFGVKSSWIIIPSLKGVVVFNSPDNYTFFHHQEILKDETMGIELDLSKIFE